jgi:sugar lactone lactonase YvrE
MEIACIHQGKDVVGECPVWDAEQQTLYWVDVDRGKVHRRNAPGVVECWQFDGPVSAVALTTSPHVLLVAVGGNLLLWSPSDDIRTILAHVETRFPSMRLNDGAVGPASEFWVGSMTNNVAADGNPVAVHHWDDGTLYRACSNGTVTTIDCGFRVPNTVVWSPDERLFYCGCSIQNTIWRYDYDPASQSISHRRPFLLPSQPGSPDGSAIDADGFLWNCRWGGGAILRISPQGEVVLKVDLPISNPTSCTFGGPNLTTLYVTSAALGTSAQENLAGALFSIETGVRGLPARRFRLPS